MSEGKAISGVLGGVLAGGLITAIGLSRIKPIDVTTLREIIKYFIVEESMRCFDIIVDDVFAVPSGSTLYVKSLYVSNELYVDGDLKVV